MTTEIELKREFIKRANDLVKMNNPVMKMAALGCVCHTLGKLLGLWTGETVSIKITAEGQAEGVFASKGPTQ